MGKAHARVGAIGATGAAAMVALTVAPAWADPIPDTLTYDFFVAGCDTESEIAEAFLYTHLERPVATSDNDNDVNVGDTVWTSLRADGTDGEVSVSGVETTFFIGDGSHTVTGDFSIPAGSSEQVTLAEAGPYTVTAADAGRVIDLGVTRIADPDVAAPCDIPAEHGTHSLYVNRAPALVDDLGWTYWNTPIRVPVLDNDDATWDSGTIDSSVVTLAAAQAVQDDLRSVPAERIGSNVGIATGSPHGDCALDPDGWIGFSPHTGYTGTAYCRYGVLDNDGAYSEALLQLEVISPDEITSIELTATATEVLEGGEVRFAANGTAAGWAEIGDVTADVTFASDAAGDVVTGDTIRFPTAGSRTITATHLSGASASIAIEVRAADAGRGELAATGGSPAGAIVALGALLAGTGAAILSHRGARQPA